MTAVATHVARPSTRATTRAWRACAPARWPVMVALALVEAIVTGGRGGLDLMPFAAGGSAIVHGHVSQVYAAASEQGGPLQLLACWAVTDDGRLTVWAVAVVNCAMLVLARYACRAGGATSAAREAIVGALVVYWLLPSSGFWTGHPAEIAIPLLWMLVTARARAGRWLVTGLAIGVATAVAPWGVLGVPVVLLAPVRRAIAAVAVAAGVALLAYLPFALSGAFGLFDLRWHIQDGTLAHLLLPGAVTFDWYLRLVQGALAAGSCAVVALRCRRTRDVIWLAPLAATLVRVITDPVLGVYYWQPTAAIMIAAIALGAPRRRSASTLAAVVMLSYAPMLSSASHLRLVTSALCLAALALLVVTQRRGGHAGPVDDPASAGPMTGVEGRAGEPEQGREGRRWTASHGERRSG